jgi:1-acyl-sn-glycerol-3-phosphate acyltransferase
MNRTGDFFRWVLWNVFSRPFVRFYLYPKYHYQLAPGSARFPKPPFIVVANHGTFFDPWIIGSFSVTPFAFMINDDALRGKGVSQWYLRRIGTIPKKKGATDFKAMRLTIETLLSGYPVCIFPEGQTSWDGETQPLYKGIEKVIKKASCPLVIVHSQGNFLTKPWWARSIRKGKIMLTIEVLDKIEIAAIAPEALFERIRKTIYQNDIKDPENRKVSFSGEQLAEGLERFVWMCPSCGHEDTLVCSENDVTCVSCGTAITIDAYCRFAEKINGMEDLKDWVESHKKMVIGKIGSAAGNSTLTVSSDVELQRENPDRTFSTRAKGSLSLTKQELTFSAGPESLVIPVAETEDFVIQKKDIFEIRHGKEYYRFLFNKRSPMKWIFYIRYLKGYEEAEKRGWL